MKKIILSVMVTAALASPAFAGLGDAVKSVGQVAGQAVAQVAVERLTPEAQAVVNNAKAIANVAGREDYILIKAKKFLGKNNYQAALDLANYVVTTLNAGSVDAKKIAADAKAALVNMAKNKMTAVQTSAPAAQEAQATAAAAEQVKEDVTQTAEGVKTLFGTK